jgi:formylglycine-generating enzyme required for sulfatase activity
MQVVEEFSKHGRGALERPPLFFVVPGRKTSSEETMFDSNNLSGHRAVVLLGFMFALAVAGRAPTAEPAGATVNPKDGLKYVWIPPGTFMMGCSPGDNECDFEGDEQPSHQVTISKGFWLGQTPVTVAAYKRFAQETSAQMPPAPDFNPAWRNEELPIVRVTWEDARAYCTWAGGRLPTEAEWEYAARGGSTEPRYGRLDEVAWYAGNSGGRAHEVGQKSPNNLGLYDMLGNVWEWVNDWYDHEYYQNSPAADPQGPSRGRVRVLRGGCWVNEARIVRVSDRNVGSPGGRGISGEGFRCALEVRNP